MDYIEITEVEEDTPFNIAETSATLSRSRKSLWFPEREFLAKVILCDGQLQHRTKKFQWMFDNTGKWPAMAGFDLINYTTTWEQELFAMTTNVQEWWDNGIYLSCGIGEIPEEYGRVLYRRYIFDISKLVIRIR